MNFLTWAEIKFSPENCLLILFSSGNWAKNISGGNFKLQKSFRKQNMSDFCSCWKPSKKLHKKNDFQEKKTFFLEKTKKNLGKKKFRERKLKKKKNGFFIFFLNHFSFFSFGKLSKNKRFFERKCFFFLFCLSFTPKKKKKNTDSQMKKLFLFFCLNFLLKNFSPPKRSFFLLNIFSLLKLKSMVISCLRHECWCDRAWLHLPPSVKERPANFSETFQLKTQIYILSAVNA